MLATTLATGMRFAREIRAIKRSSLPKPQKDLASRAWMNLNFHSENRIPNPVQLLGHEIHYVRAAHLKYLFREIFVEETYFFRTDAPQPLIVDCGSNIGMSILYFKALYPNARVIGFEPDPTTFAKLRDNVVRNGLSDVVLHECALANEEGQAEFYRSDTRSLEMSLDKKRLNGDVISVPLKRLSSFLEEEVDLLKIDVEGAEMLVMQDLASTEKLRLVKQMHLEYHHHIDGNNDALSSMLKLIEDNGFGYQIASEAGHQAKPRTFQDISIYAYRKDKQ